MVYQGISTALIALSPCEIHTFDSAECWGTAETIVLISNKGLSVMFYTKSVDIIIRISLVVRGGWLFLPWANPFNCGMQMSVITKLLGGVMTAEEAFKILSWKLHGETQLTIRYTNHVWLVFMLFYWCILCLLIIHVYTSFLTRFTGNVFFFFFFRN